MPSKHTVQILHNRLAAEVLVHDHTRADLVIEQQLDIGAVDVANLVGDQAGDGRSFAEPDKKT